MKAKITSHLARSVRKSGKYWLQSFLQCKEVISPANKHDKTTLPHTIAQRQYLWHQYVICPHHRVWRRVRGLFQDLVFGTIYFSNILGKTVNLSKFQDILNTPIYLYICNIRHIHYYENHFCKRTKRIFASSWVGCMEEKVCKNHDFHMWPAQPHTKSDFHRPHAKRKNREIK